LTDERSRERVELVKRLAIALVLLALVAASVAWLGARDRTVRVIRGSSARESAPVTQDELAPASAPAPRSEAAPSVPDSAPEDAGEDEALEAESGAAAGLSLECRFVQPDGAEVEVEEAQVILEGARTYRGTCARASRLTIDGIEPGSYALRAEATGFDCLGRSLDLSESGDADVVLWPAGWIAVVVRTPEGRPFAEIARDLGVDPQQVFVGAFQVVSHVEPPDGDSWATASSIEPALFIEPPGYKSWEVSGTCIGSLFPRVEPPLWVGLKVFGVPLGWELVPHGAREVVFTLDARAFAAHLATLTLRVVDAATGAPLSDAPLTLLADTSAYRRRDHHEVLPDAEGLVTFDRIVPDRYELSITRGEAFHQERLALAPGEQRDLGEIAIGTASALVLRVVDEEGQPVDAWIEVGPYEAGARAEDLYPSMISRGTDQDGEHRLACPSRLSIVRAKAIAPGPNGWRMPSGPCSAHTLLDPARLAPGALVLVVHEPVDVALDVQGIDSGTCEVVDQIGLVVVARTFDAVDPLRTLSLVPGRYHLRIRDAESVVVAEKDFDVERTPGRVTIP
jgi:hypothetical protein